MRNETTARGRFGAAKSVGFCRQELRPGEAGLFGGKPVEMLRGGDAIGHKRNESQTYQQAHNNSARDAFQSADVTFETQSFANGFFGLRIVSRTGTAPKPSSLRIELTR